MLTHRGWVALATGIAAYVAAVGFGAGALVPLALALVLGPLLAFAVVRRHRRAALRLTIASHPARPVAGEPVRVTATVAGETSGSGRLQLDIGGRVVSAPLLRGATGDLQAVYDVPGLPRGVHAVENGELAFGDPFGFSRADRGLAGASSLVVWPRWTLAGETVSGALIGDDVGARARRAQPVGYDLHGIREHQHGESLRRVDWKTSARTGRLMVREMEDASIAGLTILVDLDHRALAQSGDALEQMLRVAASLVHGVGANGDAAALVLAGAAEQRVALDGGSASWFTAMDALAAVSADRQTPLVDVVMRDPSLLAGSALIVLTASSAPALVGLLAREATRVPVQVVHVADEGAEAWREATGIVVDTVPTRAVAGVGSPA